MRFASLGQPSARIAQPSSARALPGIEPADSPQNVAEGLNEDGRQAGSDGVGHAGAGPGIGADIRAASGMTAHAPTHTQARACAHTNTPKRTQAHTHECTTAHTSCGAPPRPQELSCELYSVKKLTDVEHVCYLLRIDSPEANEDGPSPVPTAHADSNSQGGATFPAPSSQHARASRSARAGPGRQPRKALNQCGAVDFEALNQCGAQW